MSVLSLDRVRELIGPEGDDLSDDQIAEIRDRARTVVRVFLDGERQRRAGEDVKSGAAA